MKVSDGNIEILRQRLAGGAISVSVLALTLRSLLDELLALRRVADAAEAYIAADMDDYHTSSTTDLCAALTAAGR